MILETRHQIARYVPLFLFAAALVACTTGSSSSDAGRYLHRSPYSFVRIEPIEAGAPDNAHPAPLETAALRKLLTALRTKGTIGSDDEPVFADAELDEIVEPLAHALASAGPREDVSFAVPGRHGWLRKYSGKTVTTGRVFVRDGEVNVIFGLIHDPFEITETETGLRPVFVPGSRRVRLERIYSIVSSASARTLPDRPDWVVVGAAAGTTAETNGAASTTSTGSDHARYDEIEQALDALERSKADGKITEEQYRERRREILERLKR